MDGPLGQGPGFPTRQKAVRGPKHTYEISIKVNRAERNRVRLKYDWQVVFKEMQMFSNLSRTVALHTQPQDQEQQRHRKLVPRKPSGPTDQVNHTLWSGPSSQF